MTATRSFLALALLALTLPSCVSPPVIPAPAPEHLHHDFDADGYCEQAPCAEDAIEGDCDDTDPAVSPAAAEVCDGLDNDCDGALPDDEVDGDGDGHLACVDCDDAEPTVFPGAEELCDGLDTNCDGDAGDEEADEDGDGASICGGDCDDDDPLSHPGANELCDGLDNDCDEALPDDEQDVDADGIAPCEGDCDDGDALVGPVDLDGDGYDACDGPDDTASTGDEDCDDADPAVHPGDADGDGYGACWGADGTAATGDEDCDDDDDSLHPGDADSDGVDACWGDDGLAGTGDEDCDDADPAVLPGATEVCDGVDDDCDGTADDGPAILTWYADVDGDGWGDPAVSADLCDGAQPDGWVTDGTDCDDLEHTLNHDDNDGDLQSSCDGDCDDLDGDVYDGATEVCDGIDNDCDAVPGPDEGDADGDGWMPCEGDCDDGDSDTWPGAAEVPADGIDQDCDGTDLSLRSWPLTVTRMTAFGYDTPPDHFGSLQADADEVMIAWSAQGSSCCNCSNFHARFVRSIDGGATFTAPVEASVDGFLGISLVDTGSDLLLMSAETTAAPCDGRKPRVLTSSDAGASWSVTEAWDPVPGSVVGCASEGGTLMCRGLLAGSAVHNFCSIATTTGAPEIYSATSFDGGGTWTSMTPVSLANDLPDCSGVQSGYDAAPAVASDGSSILIAWPDESSGDLEIHFSRSDDDGATWQPVTNVSNRVGQDERPYLDAAGDTVVLGWIADYPVDSASYWHQGTAYVAFSDDRGVTWTAPIQLGDPGTVDRIDVDLLDSGTAYVVAYVDDGVDQSGLLTRTSDLGASWEPWIDFTGTTPAGLPMLRSGDGGLVVDDDEVVHIIWEDQYTSCCPSMNSYYTRLE